MPDPSESHWGLVVADVPFATVTGERTDPPRTMSTAGGSVVGLTWHVWSAGARFVHSVQHGGATPSGNP